MALIVASDYQVLRDGGITLGEGSAGSEQFSLTIHPFLMSTAGRRDKAVLTFNIRPEDGARLSVTAIGSGPTKIMDEVFFSKSHTRMHQEAFDLAGIVTETGDVIGTPIGSLLIEFKVDKGPVVLSDIVVHYKIQLPGG